MSSLNLNELIDSNYDPLYKDSGLSADIDEHIRRREKHLTNFVETTVDNYRLRWKAKRSYQHFITITLLIIVILFALADLSVIVLSILNLINDVGIIITLLASITTSFLSSIFSMLLVVVKYVFPSKEEENSMEVLKTTFMYNYRYINQQNKTCGKGPSQN